MWHDDQDKGTISVDPAQLHICYNKTNFILLPTWAHVLRLKITCPCHS